MIWMTIVRRSDGKWYSAGDETGYQNAIEALERCSEIAGEDGLAEKKTASMNKRPQFPDSGNESHR